MKVLRTLICAGKNEFSFFGENMQFSQDLWRKRGKSDYQSGYDGDCMEMVWRVILFMEILW